MRHRAPCGPHLLSTDDELMRQSHTRGAAARRWQGAVRSSSRALISVILRLQPARRRRGRRRAARGAAARVLSATFAATRAWPALTRPSCAPAGRRSACALAPHMPASRRCASAASSARRAARAAKGEGWCTGTTTTGTRPSEIAEAGGADPPRRRELPTPYSYGELSVGRSLRARRPTGCRRTAPRLVGFLTASAPGLRAAGGRVQRRGSS